MASTVSAVVLLTWFYVMFLFLSFWLLPLACETLVPRPGIELLSPALKGGVFFFFFERWSLNHWTDREVPNLVLKLNKLEFRKVTCPKLHCK